VLPSLPGFLVKVNRLSAASVPPLLVSLFDYAWFIGFALAFVIYLLLAPLEKRGSR
jgi:NCS1 family nucleobase:cation symporter-1